MSSDFPAVAAGNSPLVRKLLVSILFVLTNIVAWHVSNNGQDGLLVPSIAVDLPFHLLSADHNLSSGVGLVTKDGAWDENDKRYEHDIKILGFTDVKYVPIAKHWYNRLTALGYTEHYIVAHDEESYNSLIANDFRALPCFIRNPDYGHPVKGLWQQIMSSRLHFTLDMLKNGTHLLITDVDNVFSRYVPLTGFLDEGYDAYHAFEMMYPLNIYNDFGFVICSGHQFIRSSPESLKFMELVMKRCNREKCDDQVIYNTVFFHDLKIKWDNDVYPDNDKALRVNSTHVENGNLLVESVTGRSTVTNHTIKIWDRDFAWRLAGAIPEYCPSMNNWLGMPTKLDDKLTGPGNKIYKKLAAFDVWDGYCRVER